MEVAVIGLGRFGSQVARTLARLGHEVIAIDQNENLVEALKDEVAHAASTDATVESNLRSLGVADVDCAVVAIGENVEGNIMVAAMLKEMGIPRVIARAVRPLQGSVLRRIGVNRVVHLEELMGEQVARSLASAQVLESVPLAEGFSLEEILAPPFVVGKTLRELDLRQQFGISIVAIKVPKVRVSGKGEILTDYAINPLPGPDDQIGGKDVLVIVGSPERIASFTRGEAA